MARKRAPVEVLTAKGAAARIGVEWATFRKYMQQGRTPDMDVLIDGEPKGWLPETIDAWNDSRPGPGKRTDLNDQPPRRA